MGKIKNMFQIRSKPELDNQAKEDTRHAREQLRITYYQSGYGASRKASGNPTTLGVCLQNLFNEFENLCRQQLNEQERLKQPFRQAQEEKRTELKKRETLLTISSEKKKNIEEEIEENRFQISDVKQHPDKYGIDADKRPKVQFWIGLLLLIPITIYLFVFYISASFSAFFKDFESSSLSAAIFDANAFSKAVEDGWLEALFVGTIPFVFMGLGYLVHMFRKNKGLISNLKLVALLVLTFVFDVILAYLIEKKIFDFERQLGQEFSPSIAVTSVNFWGIIFAGFVVYVIWGLVFDFVMMEYENIDKIKAFIRNKKEEIKNLSNQRQELKSVINNIRQEIASINGSISEFQNKIDGFIFPIKEYLHYHYQYVEGWYQAINAEIALPQKEKDQLRDSCEEVANAHLVSRGLTDLNSQNIIFTAN